VTETGIVTPEAVVLAFDTAGVGSRVPAELIDLAIQAAAFGAFAIGFSILGSTPFGSAGVYFGLFAVMFAYPIGIETLWRGRSVGKAAMGLRVVTVEGGQIRFRHALVRGILGLVDFWATGGAAAVICVLATSRNQRLGDLVAGTLVLRERTGARAPSATEFRVPPGWEPYAESLDVSGLTATDYQAARSFLLRAGSLDPMTRDRLARQIATPLLGRLRHAPPPGVLAEAFLLCVAARYQQRQRVAVGGGSGYGAPWQQSGGVPPAWRGAAGGPGPAWPAAGPAAPVGPPPAPAAPTPVGPPPGDAFEPPA
jgi:uncharacterized RDD family membrane protein YckC